MNAMSGNRKAFADAVVEKLTALLKENGLEEVEVHRGGDPVIVAARGCLKGRDGADEKVELLLQISSDLQRADERTLVGAQVALDPVRDVSRAFDLSEVVAKDSVARAAEPEREEEC